MERERLLQDSGICITLWQRRRQQNSIYCYADKMPGWEKRYREIGQADPI